MHHVQRGSSYTSGRGGAGARWPALTFNAWLRFDVLRRLLADFSGSSFLEIGCGEGALGGWLAQRYEYTGYEPDPQSYAVASRRLEGVGTVLNEFLPDRPSRTFDLVGAFEVLEHVEQDKLALRQWLDWVVPGGHLLLSVPANPERFGAADHRVGHYRRYTTDQLRAVLQESGFEDAAVYAYGFPLGYALEAVRNALAVHEEHTVAMEDRTAASGRLYQPPERGKWVPRVATLPFRWMQRPFRQTSLGTGLVATARKPR